MTVREAMDTIHGALDVLYEFYGHDAESVFEDIDIAEDVLEKIVQIEESKPKNCYAHCPECGEQLFYDDFIQNDEYCDEIVLFEAEGHCPKCQNTYTWTETFELAEIKFDN